MKSLIVFAALFAASWAYSPYRVHGQSNAFSLYERPRSSVAQAMYELRTKTERVCPGYGDKFVDVILPNVTTCIESAMQDDQSLCYNSKYNVKSCLGPVEDMFGECSSKKFLFPIIRDSVFSIEDAFCTSTGEELIELYRPCITHQSYKMMKIKRILSALSLKEDWPADKSEFCGDINKIAAIVQSMIDECPSSVTRRSGTKMLNAAIYQCKETENEIDVDVV